MTTTATRYAKSAAAPLGTGELHRALDSASKAAALQAFCRNTGTRPDEVSANGTDLDILRVFDAMRARGYQVSEPQRPQHQPRKGFTAWWVHIRMPGAEFALGFYTVNEQLPANQLHARNQA
ncbi:hypothetical protein ACSUZJ_07320 [Telluria sp. B2]